MFEVMVVKLHKDVIKKLRKLPRKIEEKFYDRVDLFIINKFDKLSTNHSVDSVYPNCHSINITGDYRAIYREREGIITFMYIGTHSELY